MRNVRCLGDAALAPPAPTLLRNIVESRGFTDAVTIVIAVNAVTLGLETWPLAMQTAGPVPLALNTLALWIFTVEIGLKLWLYRGRFFRDAWNVFDFLIVAVAWVPTTGPFSVLRIVRVLNLFIALIVNSMQSMQSETNDHVRAEALVAHDEREALARRIEA